MAETSELFSCDFNLWACLGWEEDPGVGNCAYKALK